MNEKSTIARHSLSQVKAMRDRGDEKPAPTLLRPNPSTPTSGKTPGVVMPAEDKDVRHLRLDNDVISWSKPIRQGHLTRMNAVLRAYVDAQKHCA